MGSRSGSSLSTSPTFTQADFCWTTSYQCGVRVFRTHCLLVSGETDDRLGAEEGRRKRKTETGVRIPFGAASSVG